MRRLVLLFLLCGCPHYAKLDPKNVTALEAASGEDAQTGRICARGGLVDVIATTKDGKKLPEGGAGQLDEKHFDPALVQLTASVGTFHERSWNPPDEAIALLDKKVKVTATLVSNPSITSTIELEPHWACEPPVALLGGADGGNGGDGNAQGADAPGGDGGGGGAGGNAPSSTIAIGYIPHGNGKLVLVDIVTTGVGEFMYVLDPSISMRVWAGGGAGGAGGMGSFGNSATQPSERPTNGGRGGDGGDGGDGGYVVVQYDAASPELLKYVNVDVSAGQLGAAGQGGAGGTNSNAGGHDASAGPDGRPGRVGRNGTVQTQPMAGISANMTAYVGGGKKQEVREPTPPPQVATTKPDRRRGKAHAEPVAPPEPARPAGPPPKHYNQDDGARVYVGEAGLDVIVPKTPKLHRKSRVEVISTRTRKHHFTIQFADNCTLAFHRPDGEKRHVYDLDHPTDCPSQGAKLLLKTGRLELDTAHDTLALSLAGSVAAPCQGRGCTPVTGTVSVALEAKRR